MSRDHPRLRHDTRLTDALAAAASCPRHPRRGHPSSYGQSVYPHQYHVIANPLDGTLTLACIHCGHSPTPRILEP